MIRYLSGVVGTLLFLRSLVIKRGLIFYFLAQVIVYGIGSGRYMQMSLCSWVKLKRVRNETPKLGVTWIFGFYVLKKSWRSWSRKPRPTKWVFDKIFCLHIVLYFYYFFLYKEKKSTHIPVDWVVLQTAVLSLDSLAVVRVIRGSKETWECGAKNGVISRRRTQTIH